MHWSFRIDGPILAWKRPGQRGKARFDPRDQSAYKKMVATICMIEMRKAGVRQITGPVALGVDVFFKRPERLRKAGGAYHTQKPDFDNIIKNIKDALKDVAWIDDAQVARYTDGGKFYLLPDSSETEHAIVRIADAGHDPRLYR